MIYTSVKRFIASNLRQLGDWTPNRCPTQSWWRRPRRERLHILVSQCRAGRLGQVIEGKQGRTRQDEVMSAFYP